LLGNIEEHHLFDIPMDATWLYLRRCRAALTPPPPASPVPEPPAEVLAIDLGRYGLDPSRPFDPQALRTHIEGWARPLVEHLKDEIHTISPEYIAKVGQGNIETLDKAVLKHLQGYDPSWFLCSVYGG
jgi:hypothetical protein